MLAFSSKSPYVPDPKRNDASTRWIASLSDGSTVFEDITPGLKSAWLRLRDYIELHDLKITNLRLEAYGRNVTLVPYKDGEGNPQLNGYWHSKRMGTLIHGGGTTEVKSCGIGILKNRDVWISWVREDGIVTQEIRQYKNDDLAAIINNEV